MPILRTKEIQKMEAKELASKTEEMRKELMKLKSQASMGTAPESPGKIRALKKTLARMLTLRQATKSEETKKQ